MVAEAGKSSSAPPWDALIEVTAYVRVKARPNPDYFEGWDGRTAEQLAREVVFAAGTYDLSNRDGWADLVGSAVVEDVQ